MTGLLAALLLLVCCGSSIAACEPIVPLGMVLGGPAMLAKSFLVLLLAVAVKSILFALFQRRHIKAKAAIAMVAANILSTIIGLLIAAAVTAAPEIILFGFVVAALLTIFPARRLAPLLRLKSIRQIGAAGIVAMVMGMMVLSIILWACADSLAQAHVHLARYWLLKTLYVYLALTCSLFITAFYEEWVIWRISGEETGSTVFVSAVIKANLWTIGLVALFAAIIMLPERWRSGDFLVYAVSHLWHRITGFT